MQRPPGVVAAKHALYAVDHLHNGTSVRAPSHREIQQLRHILAGPDFHPQVSPLDRLQQWVAAELNHFLNGLASQLHGHPASFGFVGLVALALVAALTFFLGRDILKRVGSETSAPLDIVKGLTAAEAFALADRLAASGDNLQGLRALFAASLLQLGEQGFLVLRPGVTNHEYVRQLKDAAPSDTSIGVRRMPAPAIELFERLTALFERAWYGRHLVDPEGYRQAAAVARQLADSIRERAA